MSDIIPEIEARRARRGYSGEEIPRDVLERVLTAAALAPSCNNKQPWRYMIATEGPALEHAREALMGGNYWAKVAPVLVVVTTRNEFDCLMPDGRAYAHFDTGMASYGLMLQAWREGLYAHPMAGFEPQKLRDAFGIEDATDVITMIALGYPGDAENLNEKHAASEVSERSRKGLDEFVTWNTWTEPSA